MTKGYIYTTWECQDCPVKTSRKEFGEQHRADTGHNIVVQKWEPINA